MKVAMQDVAKKLALWHTPTFRPLTTHDDLEPIMASIGFVSLNNSRPSGSLRWKEYYFELQQPSPAAFISELQPRPRLPFPRIDGLHLLSYKAFFRALEHYVSSTEVYNIFHVRAMPLTCLHDRVFEKVYRPMKGCGIDDDGIYVFRDGTIDQSMLAQVATTKGSSIDSDDDNNGDCRLKGSRCQTNAISLIAWDSLLPKGDLSGPG